MSIDFTPGIINTYHGDIYNCTTNTDNAKTPDTPKWPCDNWNLTQGVLCKQQNRLMRYACQAYK